MYPILSLSWCFVSVSRLPEKLAGTASTDGDTWNLYLMPVRGFWRMGGLEATGVVLERDHVGTECRNYWTTFTLQAGSTDSWRYWY